MKYICHICGKEVSIPDADESLHNNDVKECQICYSVIFAQRYCKAKRPRTYFAYTGDRLGDKILFEFLLEQYKKANPKELVNVLPNFKSTDDARRFIMYNADVSDKIFWSDVSGPMPDLQGIIWYPLTSEVNHYRDAGIYPEWKTFKIPKKDVISYIEHNGLIEWFVVLHLRNIEKCPSKNSTLEEFGIVRDMLKHLRVIIVGNDGCSDYEENLPDKWLDLRNKLTLNEIAYIMKRCEYFIGKDSGIVHLAAACGVKIVTWGYKSSPWIPKCKPNQMVYINGADKDHSRLTTELAIIWETIHGTY